MKVAIFLFAVVAVASAASYGSRQTIDASHVPNYSVDWAVEDDYYNSYAMTEDRKGDTTKNIIRVALPGKSMIKRDDLIDAQMRLSQSVGGYSSSSGISSGGLLNDDVLIDSRKLNSGRLGSSYGKSIY